jgi:putative (di)nucleoside polyphosphate hydrolase
MKVSYGVLLLNEQHELLLCHATGARHWDIPKGGADEGESPEQAALRELKEETGLALPFGRIQDLGERTYIPSKRLHLFLFGVEKKSIDLAALCCTSTFRHPKSGRELPEVDAYRWASVSKLQDYCTANLCKTLAEVAPLRRQAGA